MATYTGDRGSDQVKVLVENGVHGASDTKHMNGIHRINGHSGVNRQHNVKDHGETNGLNGVDGCSAHASSVVETFPTCPNSVEPIAIIGMAMRFPGQSCSSETFWKMLLNGKNLAKDVPPDRWNLKGWTSEGLPSRGVFVEQEQHPSQFDAPFFNVGPLQAELMDPGQRWMLELTYEALENAGLSMEDVSGTQTSVHVGANNRDYEKMYDRGDPHTTRVHAGTGSAISFLSNRISWHFNLQGPSMSLDTGCSSSSLGLHYACKGLRDGDAKMALVAGSQMVLNPDGTKQLNELGMISPDGVSYSFDHRANGFGRGEGSAVILLKPLSSALRDGNTIRALIRSTAANQDGKSGVMTQPNSTRQEVLMKRTYELAGIDPSRTRYFEAHGTGTPIGDAVEADAIENSFKPYRTKDEPIYVGAVKSLIGHLEAASGMASLIKAVLALEKGMIPPNANFERQNPKISPDTIMKFPVKPTPWPTEGLRRASVSSYAVGGTSVHIVLDDAYHYLHERGIQAFRHTTIISPRSNHTHTASDQGQNNAIPPRLFLFSAYDEGGLSRLAGLYSEYLDEKIRRGMNEEDIHASLAYTLSNKRARMSWRTYACADSATDLTSQLKDGLFKSVRATQSPNLAFVFSGQGAQYARMGLGLMIYPVFARSMKQADRYLTELGSPWSFLEELKRPESTSRISEPGLSQPICTAVQLALVDLLRAWGVSPHVVIGHSSGEVAAAYCVSALSRESALKVAYFRGVVAEDIRTGAEAMAMMSVGLSEENAVKLLEKHGHQNSNKITIACINSTENVTLSGSAHIINKLEALLKNEGVFARKLKVEVAYHSRFMDAGAEKLERSIGALENLTLAGNMISTVTGCEISNETLGKASYWARNFTSPVLFRDGVTKISKDFSETSDGRASGLHWVEVGFHATLKGPLQQTLRALSDVSSATYSPMMIRGVDNSKPALEMTGDLLCRGYAVDIEAVNGVGTYETRKTMLTDLPVYPWNHSKSYWGEGRISKSHRLRDHGYHSLLGYPASDWNQLEPRWSNLLSTSTHGWVKHHQVNGKQYYPGVGFLLAAIQASKLMSAKQDDQIHSYHLRQVHIEKPLILPPDGSTIEWELRMTASAEISHTSMSWNDFSIFAHDTDHWIKICWGQVAIQLVEKSTSQESDFRAARIEDLSLLSKKRFPKSVTTERFYNKIAQRGIAYGPAFATLNNIRYNDDGEAIASLDLEEWRNKIEEDPKDQPHILHPAALDPVLQISFAAMAQGIETETQPFVPTRIKEMCISARQSEGHLVTVYARSERHDLHHVQAESLVVDAACGTRRIWVSFEASMIENEVGESPDTVKDDPIAWGNRWLPDIDLMDPNQVSEYIRGLQIDEDILKERDTYHNRSAEKELYCRAVIHKANKTFKPERQPANNPKLAKYASWIRAQLTERLLNGVTIPQLDEIAQNPDTLQRLEDSVGSQDPTGKVLTTVGRNLESLIYGEVSGVEILFRDAQLLNGLYAYWSSVGTAAKRARDWLVLATHKNAGLKILEIGAGTGGTTRRMILREHDGRDPRQEPLMFDEYTFTDISVSFFEAAREEFKSVEDRMKYAALDIGVDPVEQGFQENYYDVVLASNVIHGTPDMSVTLANVRKLLKPGGVFLLHEITEVENVSSGFIFGILDGWWLAKEPIRHLGPLLDEENWDRYLRNSGFSGIESEFVDEAGIKNALMIARKPLVIKQEQLQPDSFFIIHEDKSTMQVDLARHLKEAHPTFNCASIIPVSKLGEINLARASILFLPELEHPFLQELSARDWSNLHELIKAADRLLWLKSSGANLKHDAAFAIVDGLRVSIEREKPTFRFATLSLNIKKGRQDYIPHICKVFERMCRKDEDATPIDAEYKVVDGLVHVKRVVPLEERWQEKISGDDAMKARIVATEFKSGHSRAFKLALRTPGDLETLHFVDDVGAGDLELLASEIEVEVLASSLNFRDVSAAVGNLKTFRLGYDCAGIVRRTAPNTCFRVGDHVMALAKENSIRTFARCDSRCAAKIPKGKTIQEAAAMPAIFLTALGCVERYGRMKDGESIMVHSGAGGLGQAIIQLVKHLHPGATIFATVGSSEKKHFLETEYGILGSNILSNRDQSLVESIGRLTHGRGVDVIISSLKGESLRSTWNCIAPFGRFVDVGGMDIDTFDKLPMAPFARGASFAAFDLLDVAKQRPEVITEMFTEISHLWQSGAITVPSPYKVVGISHLEEAFGELRSGGVIGKIGIAMTDHLTVKATADRPLLKTKFDPLSSYLIAGGLGGLGRKLATWMISRGARNLILLGRGGENKDEKSRQFVAELRDQGVTIVAPPCDVADRDTLKRVLDDCSRNMPPIKGCLQGAMSQVNGQWEDLRYEDYAATLRSKVDGTINLHELLPGGLDFLIMLSTSMSIIGGHGQALYSAGCAFQDEYARGLVRTGQRPETSTTNLSIVHEAGYSFDRDLTHIIERRGFRTTTIPELYRIIDMLCNPDPSELPLKEVMTGLHSPAWLRTNDIEVPQWLYSPLFTRVFHSRSQNATTARSGDESDYRTRLSSEDSPEKVARIISEGICMKVSRMLAMDMEDIDETKPTHFYGIDSLGAVELRGWIQRNLGCKVTASDLTGDRPIRKLGEDFVSLCHFARGSVQQA